MRPEQARLADQVRKVCALGLSVGATVLMLRTLFLLAHGRLSWLDGELWGFLVLATVAGVWISKARPVGGVRAQPPETATEESVRDHSDPD